MGNILDKDGRRGLVLTESKLETCDLVKDLLLYGQTGGHFSYRGWGGNDPENTKEGPNNVNFRKILSIY